MHLADAFIQSELQMRNNSNNSQRLISWRYFSSRYRISLRRNKVEWITLKLALMLMLVDGMFEIQGPPVFTKKYKKWSSTIKKIVISRYRVITIAGARHLKSSFLVILKLVEFTPFFTSFASTTIPFSAPFLLSPPVIYVLSNLTDVR